MASIDNLDIQISVSAEQAEKSIDNLASAVLRLQKSMGGATLANAKNFSNAIFDISRSLSNVNTAGSQAVNGIDKVSKSTTKTSKTTTKAAKSFKSLSQVFGSFYANFFWVKNAIDGIGDSVKDTADYIEAFNYFNVALGKIGSDWSHQFEKYGYENAEAYAESFSERLTQSLSGLSGVQIEMSADGSGLLTETGMKNLGLNIKEVTQYASQLASITNSVGQTGEVSLTTASAFTKLGADISSLFNMDYSAVMKNLQSGLIGQSRALYKYGIDITNATLQTYAYELGLSKAVSEMTQAEKMQLRMIAILDQSKISWGDLANTLNSPSNMIRQFTNNLKETGMVLGQLLIPLLQKVMPVINGVTIAIKRLLGSIANVLGIKLDLNAFGQGYNQIEEDVGGVADSFNEATAAAKKFKTYTLGIDELNIQPEQSDSSGSNSGGFGGGIDLTDEILKATQEYERAWKQAFANMENKAEAFADRIEKMFQPITEPLKNLFSDIRLGKLFAAGQNLSDLVSGIFELFNRAISSVNWSKLGEKIGKFFSGIDWGKALNSASDFIKNAIISFLDTIGNSLRIAPLETIFFAGILLKGKKVSKILESINGLLGKTKINITNVKKAGKLAVTSFLEFSAVSDTFKNLTLGSKDIMTALIEIGSSAGIASLALYNAFGPMSFALSAIAGIAGAINGMNNALSEKEDIELYGESLDVLSEKIIATSESIQKRTDDSKKYLETVGIAETQMAKDLADRYYDLAEKENLSNEEKYEMQSLASSLVNTLPGLEKYYDEQTRLISASRDEVDKFIQSRLREIQLAAVEEQLKEAYATRLEAQQNLNEAMEAATASQERMNELQDDYNKYTGIMDMLRQYQSLQEQIGYTTGDTSDLAEKSEKLWKQITNNGKEPHLVNFEYLNQKMNDAAEELMRYSGKYEKSKQTLQAAVMATEEAEELVVDYTTILREGMMTSADEGVECFAKEFSTNSAAEKSVLEKARDLSETMSKKTTDFKKAGSDNAEGYCEGIKQSEKSAERATESVVESAIGTAEVAAEGMFKPGQNIVSGMIKGIKNKETTLYKTLEELARKVRKTVEKELDIHSPSRVMFKVGSFTMQGFKEGMEALYSPTLKSIGEFGYVLPTVSYDFAETARSYRSAFNSDSSTHKFLYEESSYLETNALLRTQNEILLELLQKENVVNIGDREIARANARGKKSLGYELVT